MNFLCCIFSKVETLFQAAFWSKSRLCSSIVSNSVTIKSFHLKILLWTTVAMFHCLKRVSLILSISLLSWSVSNIDCVLAGLSTYTLTTQSQSTRSLQNWRGSCYSFAHWRVFYAQVCSKRICNFIPSCCWVVIFQGWPLNYTAFSLVLLAILEEIQYLKLCREFCAVLAGGWGSKSARVVR